MADVVAELATLTETVSAAIEAAGLSPFRDDRAGLRLTEAVLDILDRYTLAELSDLAGDGRLERLVAQAVADTFNGVSTELAADVAARTQDAIRAAATFYQARGIDPIPVSEAVRRSQIASRISEGFGTGLSQIGTELYQATRDATLDAVARGQISRSAIETDLIQSAGAAANKARVQAGIAVGAYNEAWNEELGRQAGLDHVRYAGTLKASSRHFCRVHLGRVFTLEEIESMDNGQLSPVRLFVGGWACRHTLVPVDLEWSDTLKARLGGGAPHAITLNAKGTRTITVVATEARAVRLQTQADLSRSGFVQFLDADAEAGFVGVHRDWKRRLGRATGAAAEALRSEMETAIEQAAQGESVLLGGSE